MAATSSTPRKQMHSGRLPITQHERRWSRIASSATTTPWKQIVRPRHYRHPHCRPPLPPPPSPPPTPLPPRLPHRFAFTSIPTAVNHLPQAFDDEERNGQVKEVGGWAVSRVGNGRRRQEDDHHKPGFVSWQRRMPRRISSCSHEQLGPWNGAGASMARDQLNHARTEKQTRD